MSVALGSIWSGQLSARASRRLRGFRARTRYRLGLPEPGLGQARVSAAFRHPVSEHRKAELISTYRNRFPESAAREIAESSRLAQHRFHLLGHPVDHGAAIAWSRDPVSGRDWSRAFSPDVAYRGGKRLGDIKLPWELNKHQYFFTLGKSGWLTDSEAPALEIIRQIDHWMTDNPYQRGINWISALEAGTRALSWILAYPFYDQYCDASFHNRLAFSLARHLQFVEEHLSVGRHNNTHLAGEAAVLVAGSLFLDSKQSAAWFARGMEILETEINAQVTRDAVHAERSPAYHRFFLDQYYLVAGLLAANGRSFSKETLNRVEEMTGVLMHLVLPDGTVPAFGDADDARGLWLYADCPADYRGLLALGAMLFGRGDFKAAAGNATEDVLWIGGIDGLQTFDRIAPRSPAATSIAYPEAGYYVMRGGWGKSDAVLTFDCGPLGYGAAGHGHADALSFQLHALGYPFLVDPGTYSYNLDYDWRASFRGTRAHNTITVDGLDQSVARDRMSWERMAHAESHAWLTTPLFDLADGEHDGYQRLADPVSHRRIIAYLKPDVWVVWDDLRASRQHNLELLLHVRPDCHLEVDPSTSRMRFTSPHGQSLSGSISRDGRAATMDVIAGDQNERSAWFSPAYGVREPSRAVRVLEALEGRCHLVTALTTAGGPLPIVGNTEGAITIRVERQCESYDTLHYRTTGRTRFDREGVRFDGALLFQRTASAGPSVIVARDFRELSVDGVLHVQSEAVIRSLVYEPDSCGIELAGGSVGDLQVHLPAGVSVVVNGRPYRSERRDLSRP